jgi:hypothetical protein
VTGHISAVADLSPNQFVWLSVTAVLLLGYVSLWYGALKNAPANLVAATLTLGAPLTAMLNVSLDGKAAPGSEQLAGYGLVIVATAFLIATSWILARTGLQRSDSAARDGIQSFT